ncbi:MAG: hypothetical protein VX549_13505 [Pseudomonadota bacterium]|nr:hypothetical protein [Pseudomonadota bacterium]
MLEVVLRQNDDRIERVLNTDRFERSTTCGGADAALSAELHDQGFVVDGTGAAPSPSTDRRSI